ncbi:MarR family transcriptional regulator [Actinotalea sp. BY-33]|uniref:MarR family transcriptional regulator n=1 Tax=Actinotalea soli TaxID=2819234 RepID=A0A939LNL5_9CELL|nr:MarR family transcriptional regulator [Actinotalea soli]MBO1751341.1 MarR family transcriptional regulator [Actinotalea soli]
MTELRQDERVAVARLHALLELLPTALDRQLAATGLTSFEFTLLEALHEADAGRLRLSALASRTNATLPRLSRVVTGLERKGLVARMACEVDGRATNAVLTEAGGRAYRDGRPVYDDAVRRMVLDGLDEEGVGRLADLAYAVLTKLDPDRRLAVTNEGPEAPCSADPAPTECAADPALPDPAACPADPPD